MANLSQLDTEDALIRASLRRTAADYPELAGLVDACIGSLTISAQWIRAYKASPVSYGLRSRVLRALVADPSVVPGIASNDLSPHVAARLVAWWEAHGGLTSGALMKEHTPKSIARFAPGVSRADAAALTTALFVEPWFAGRRSACAATQRVVAARCLTPARADTLLDGMCRYEGRWFFDTGYRALDAANGLVFVDALLRSGRQGGRIQSRIPVVLTQTFGLRRVCIPDLILWADVLMLALDGVMDPQRVQGEWLQIGSVVSAWAAFRRRVPETYDVALGEVEARLRVHWLVPGRAHADLEAARPHGLRVGTGDSSQIFNLARRLHDDRALHRFRRYYHAIDATRWIGHCRTVWDRAGSVTELVTQALATGAIPTLQARSLGNVLAHLRQSLGDDAFDRRLAWDRLLPVARATLGAVLPQPRGTHPRDGQKPAVGPGRARGPGRLPLLEALTAPRPVAYLLRPDRVAALPKDGPCFVPAAVVAGTSRVPSSIRIVGPAKVPWGACPYDGASQALAREGYEVRAL